MEMVDGLGGRVPRPGMGYLPLLIGVIALLTLILAYTLVAGGGGEIECTVPTELKVTYHKPGSADDRLNGTYWACNGLVCTRYMTSEEWVGRYCYLADDAMVCILQTQQGQIIVPLSQLNLSAVRECAQYHCMQEVLVRNASYTIPVV
jgi:hypothetical protein